MSFASRSRSRSSAPVLPMKSGFQQSIFPAGSFYSTSFSSPAAPPSLNGFATSSSSFSARSTSTFLPRSSSPTRVNLIGSSPPVPSVRFSIDRTTSPGRSISTMTNRDMVVRPPISAPGRRKTCMCSPTTHPGSFRCNLHKGLYNRPAAAAAVSSRPNRLNARRSAMTNSLVRIGTVEGELVKRALAALIRPSSHQQRRRADFRPRPSRLSKMSMPDDL